MTFPNVSGAFWGWQRKSKFLLANKVALDFVVQEFPGSTPYDFGGYGEGPYDSKFIVGVLQPMPTRRLIIKPEGQRTWKWWTFWTKVEISLDDIVVDKSGKAYRVMSQADWSFGSHFEYELTENVPPVEIE